MRYVGKTQGQAGAESLGEGMAAKLHGLLACLALVRFSNDAHVGCLNDLGQVLGHERTAPAASTARCATQPPEEPADVAGAAHGSPAGPRGPACGSGPSSATRASPRGAWHEPAFMVMAWVRFFARQSDDALAQCQIGSAWSGYGRKLGLRPVIMKQRVHLSVVAAAAGSWTSAVTASTGSPARTAFASPGCTWLARSQRCFTTALSRSPRRLRAVQTGLTLGEGQL